jgi:ABC-type transport system involved in multi-copper enzyme maturation permease subunit
MKIGYVALNTFRENVRDKVLYNLILFALLLIAGSLILGELSIGQELKIIVDLGLASISLVGTLIAIFIGIGLVYKEIDRRTIYSIISKPVERHQFLLGKFLGLMLTLAVNIAVMSLGVFTALLYLTRSWHAEYLNLLPAVALIYLELALVTAIALFFSTFSTPALSAAFTLCIWVAGHFNADFKHLSTLTRSDVLDYICNILYYLLPNFANFDQINHETIIRAAGYLKTPDPIAVGVAGLYGLLYTAIALGGAIMIFRGRDFK